MQKRGGKFFLLVFFLIAPGSGRRTQIHTKWKQTRSSRVIKVIKARLLKSRWKNEDLVKVINTVRQMNVSVFCCQHFSTLASHIKHVLSSHYLHFYFVRVKKFRVESLALTEVLSRKKRRVHNNNGALWLFQPLALRLSVFVLSVRGSAGSQASVSISPTHPSHRPVNQTHIRARSLLSADKSSHPSRHFSSRRLGLIHPRLRVQSDHFFNNIAQSGFFSPCHFNVPVFLWALMFVSQWSFPASDTVPDSVAR